MRYLLALLLLLPNLASAAGRASRNPVRAVENADPLNLKGTVTFSSGTVFINPPVFVGGGSTIATTAPITGEGTPSSPVGIDPSSATLQGNAFNGANQLVQLNGASKYPVADGSLITNIAAQDVVFQATNKSGSLMPLGTVVYVDGAQGSFPTIAFALADLHDTSHAIGVTAEDISNNQTGAVLQFGLITNVNTSMFAEGVELYLSTAILGGLVDEAPGTEDHVVHIGVVAKSNMTTGSFIVLIHSDHPQTGGVAGLTQLIKTTAELQTEACAGYPGTKCLYYNSDDDDLFTSTGSTTGQWRNTRTGLGPQ